MNLLELRNVSHRFPNGLYGIRNITLSIEKGDLALLAGENGSGKTVLMKHINCLLKPTEGDILLDGVPVGNDETETRRKVGLVFQNPEHQIVGQTIGEDVAFGPKNLGLPQNEIDDRVGRALKTVGFQEEAHRQPYTLSGGEKRKLAIAGILAMDPEILILDEPFSGLDFPGCRMVVRQILHLHREGHTIIVITHDLGKIFAKTTKLFILHQGKLVFQGKPSEGVSQLPLYGIRPHDDYKKEIDVWTG
jgi:biotin transport system ATP-binding protein